jgi:phosphoglucomutase/phosphomannomutase
MEKAFMQYCYRLLDIDFPDRGFLLFWQLPLVDKLKYFEIEDDIVNLKDISDTGERKAKLGSIFSVPTRSRKWTKPSKKNSTWVLWSI